MVHAPGPRPGPIAPEFDGQRMRFRALGDPSERASGRLTLTVIRDELSCITEQRASDDPYLHYFDGRSLYGERDFVELPLPDELLPYSAADRRIGERFADWAFDDNGLAANFRTPECGLPRRSP
ncbi:MAG: lipase [Mycobacterium sp.]|nr:lipase [Mycobacterium sp.]